ncbi:MAG TPA: SRPBCC family protein [Burkholderiales bacterium]|jgi:carbon monoxide dehydrogenase subunit G
MLKITGIIIAIAVAAVLLLAANKPDFFRVERRASIQAPPEKIFPLINDLRAFNTWNPYEKKDPNLKGRYSGPASGRGAGYAFEGNKDVGKGSVEILESSPPSKVTMKLSMVEPFRAENTVEFTLVPKGGATRVTWAMQGPAPFIAKVIHVFIDMDKMVGKDFESGLASLKVIAER